MKPNVRLHFLFLLLFFLFFSFTYIELYAEEEPTVSAASAALYSKNRDEFLYLKSDNQRLGMASTTKIMTAVVALENADLEKEIAVDARAVGTEGSSMYLKAGEKFTMRELLYGLLLRSANDAAMAIAYAVASDLPSFVALMNEKASALSLSNTHFVNPHGLDAEEHYSSAFDLAKLTAYAIDNPAFCEIISTKKKTIGKGESKRLLVNHNRLLSQYEGCFGVKTGFTKSCGRCLVSAAEKSGQILICVTLDAPNDWSDHSKLFNYGFSLVCDGNGFQE